MNSGKESAASGGVLSLEDEHHVVDLVRQAGLELLDRWPGRGRKPREKLLITTKSDGTLVSTADLLAHSALVSGLKRLFPQDHVLSEEDGQQQREAEASAAVGEPLWILDPLDGTSSFIEGRDDFGILLARAVAGMLDFGIMHFPARDILASSRRGEGTTSAGTSLRVSLRRVFAERSVNVRHAEVRDHPAIRRKWINSGDAILRLCSGELDGMIVGLHRRSVWDLAAPAILIEESGGKVTNERGENFSFDGTPLQGAYFVASNGLLHRDVLGLLRGF